MKVEMVKNVDAMEDYMTRDIIANFFLEGRKWKSALNGDSNWCK